MSYGAGGDSTVMLVRLAQRAIRPDLILFADTESERDETTSKAGSRKSIPPKSPVLATTSNIAGSALTAFSSKIASQRHTPLTRLRPKACSQKWKVELQNKFVVNWRPAQLAWSHGQRVRRAIGFRLRPKRQPPLRCR